MQPTRYAYLDGIRGIAALLVMFRHSDQLLGIATYRSHLAVDLFFMLSGFVIAHAYDARLKDGTISFSEFVQVRLIRLYPVYFASVCLAFAVALLAFLVGGKSEVNGLWQLLVATGMTLLFLPFAVSWSAYLFPLNPVYWSLFFELIVNFIYGAVRVKMTNTILKVLAGTSAFVCAMNAIRSGTMDHGYAFTFESICVGLARTFFGFSIGILLYRNKTKVVEFARGRIAPWFSVLLVVGILGSPAVPGFDGYIDLACVFLLLPLAVMGAASASPRSAAVERSMFILGSASYPLYVLHGPVIYLTWQTARRISPELILPAGLLMVVLLLFVSVKIEQYYDIPVRRWLSARRLRRVREGNASIS